MILWVQSPESLDAEFTVKNKRASASPSTQD